MNARDEMLSRLRRKKRDVTHPPAWRSRRHFDDLAERFMEALTAAKGEADRFSSRADALSAVDALFEEVGAERVVVNAESAIADIDWSTEWPTIDWHVVGDTNRDLRAFCEQADVGISSTPVALAETGSVLVDSGPGRSRLATLLPPVHIALVPTSRLTSDLFTWTAERSPDWRPPANMVFVSGPSKSADIEQTLAVGVHGPKRFIALLYDD